ncbi:MAG: GntR family transcriptional regulator [Erysipelotrichaceae bacterium]|nr:GntR family transcriptional regulator [Erysipelotrichaceae bacterium]
MTQLKTGTGNKALYLQIKDIYRDRILSGELKRGDRIESELEIQNEYDVSRITARQAILDLEKEGMVKRGRGKGTFVIWQEGIEEELNHIRSFTKEMEALGRKPGTEWGTIRKEKMDPEFAKAFDVQPKETMYCVRRVRTADDIKIVYFISYFPLRFHLPLDVEQLPESIYEVLDASGIGTPARIEEKVRAILPNEEIAKALNIQQTQPILLRQRLSYDKDNEIIEFTHCYYRGDLYTYTITSEK